MRVAFWKMLHVSLLTPLHVRKGFVAVGTRESMPHPCMDSEAWAGLIREVFGPEFDRVLAWHVDSTEGKGAPHPVRCGVCRRKFLCPVAVPAHNVAEYQFDPTN